MVREFTRNPLDQDTLIFWTLFSLQHPFAFELVLHCIEIVEKQVFEHDDLLPDREKYKTRLQKCVKLELQKCVMCIMCIGNVHWSQGLWSAGSTDILKYRVSSFRYCVLLTAS